MAHRIVAAALLVAGLILLTTRPLLAAIPLGAAVAVFMNGRGTFGNGTYRAVLAFFAAPWLALVGVVATLLGLVPAGLPGNFLFLPGIGLLVVAAVLFVGSLVALWRARRHRAKWPGEVGAKGRRR